MDSKSKPGPYLTAEVEADNVYANIPRPNLTKFHFLKLLLLSDKLQCLLLPMAVVAS